MEVSNSNKKPRAAAYLCMSNIDDHPTGNRSFVHHVTAINKIISKFTVVTEFSERSE